MARLAPKFNGIATIVLTAFVGVVVVYLGVPRLITAFIGLPTQQVLWPIRAGEPVAQEDLEALAASERRVLAWTKTGEAWRNLAHAQLLLAAPDRRIEGLDQEAISRALESFTASLSIAPANPGAWTRLAFTEVLEKGLSPSVASHLIMSIRLARYEPDLSFSRLRLCLAAWTHFAPQDRELILEQIRLAWRQSPDRVVELATELQRTDVIRTALAQNPPDLHDFDARVSKSQP